MKKHAETYIPEKHKKYDVLPWRREHGGEVIVYDCELYNKIEREKYSIGKEVLIRL